METNQLKLIGKLRTWVLVTLTILCMLLLVFSLLSGAEDYGGGLSGIVKNSPNSVPWVLFLAIVIIAWKRNTLGGILIAIFGGVITYYFNFTGSNFFLVTFIVCLLIVFLGLFIFFAGLALRNPGVRD